MYEDLESMLDGFESYEFEERAPRRPPVRTPSRQSSFAPRPTTTSATQTQVQSAARNLDSKIETLSNAVKALEGRVNGVSADQVRTTAALKKEIDDRKKVTEVIRADVQQTKVLGALLPLVGQSTVEIREVDAEGQATGKVQKVLAPPTNPIATMLPIFLLLGSGTGGDGARGGFGDGILPLLIGVSLINK